MFNLYNYIHNIRGNIELGKMRIFSQYPNMREFFRNIHCIQEILRKTA